MIRKIRNIYNEFPGQFWLLAGASLIDLIGAYLIFPFFSLYFTDKYGVSLTQVGFVFATWALAGVIGQALGGVLADKIGRKVMVIVGLIFSALTSLAMIYINNYDLIYITAAIGGLFANSAAPARQAMVADLLPEEQLSEGYSIMSVIEKAAMAIGPALGGLLASVSFVALFYIDVISSGIAAIIIFFFLMETQKHAVAQKNAGQSIGQIFHGYTKILRDKLLLAVLFLMGFVIFADEQLYFSIPVFMRDTHNMPAYYYGSIMGISSILAAVVQYPLTRKLRKFSFLMIMAVGGILYALGYGMFSFITGYPLFLIAFMIISIGSMIFYPASQAIIGMLAPEDMRGRYMAISGISWSVQIMIAPLLGGFLLDTFDANAIWYIAAIGCIIATIGNLILKARLSKASQISSE